MPIDSSSPLSQVIELNTESESLDYENLRNYAIELVQKYSGKVWTDYNLHDPGVTIIEALCFGLTDLVYKTTFPIQDILVNQVGMINYKEQSFYTADQIFSTNPTNLNDLKKIILDKVDEVQYISFTSKYDEFLSSNYRGIFTANIQLKPLIIENILSLIDREKINAAFDIIEEKIKNVFNSYRYLGIDLENVNFLKPKELYIVAEIKISKDIDPEEIIAKIYFEISNYFTQIIKFESPVELLNRSFNLSNIFDGPTLGKGVIRNNVFQDHTREVNENNIITIIKKIPGLKEVVHFTFNEAVESDEQSKLRISEDEYFTINHLSDLNKVKISTDDQEIKINKSFFDNLYKEMVSPSRLSNETELAEITNKNLHGKYRSIDVYHTIQNHFPVIYGLGIEGLSSSEGDQRLAQLKQLKAYLLGFEQIMANYLSQLSSTNKLFSNKIDSADAQTYFSQPILNITGIKEVLTFFNSNNDVQNEIISDEKAIKNLINALNKIAETDANFNDRKNSFLDHQLARFNISLNHLPVELFEQYYGTKRTSKVTNTLLWKSEILQNIDLITKNRVKAPTYKSDQNQFDFINIIYKLLYIANKPFTTLVQGFDKETNEGEVNHNIGMEIVTHQKLVLLEDIIPVIDNNSLINNSETNQGENVTIFEFQDEQVFVDACNLKNYKIIPDVFGRGAFIILFKSKSNENWRVISRAANETEAASKISQILQYFLNINKSGEGIHIVENALLRPEETEPIFGFQVVDNTTKKTILKSNNFKNKKDNNNYLYELNKFILTLTDENYSEVLDEIAKKYVLYDFIPTKEEWYIILKDIAPLFVHEPSNYSIEFINKTVNNKFVKSNFYEYKVSFIIPNWPSRFQDANFKPFLKEIITEHLPAHIVPSFYYLDIEKMKHFENLYFQWIAILNDKKSNEFIQLSLLLTNFLNTL
jgi:hypothetical protein